MRTWRFGVPSTLWLAGDSRVPWSAGAHASVWDRPLCNDWRALETAFRRDDEVVYEFNGTQLHAWRGDPEPGESCECGVWTWA